MSRGPAGPLPLEVREQPSEQFYKDEGGRGNLLRFHVAAPVTIFHSYELQTSLYHENGELVEEDNILTIANLRHLVLTPASPDCCIEFRIEKVSRRHDGQRFMLYVNPVAKDFKSGSRAVELQGIFSQPINVMSKRKTGERQVSRRGGSAHHPVVELPDEGGAAVKMMHGTLLQMQQTLDALKAQAKAHHKLLTDIKNMLAMTQQQQADMLMGGGGAASSSSGGGQYGMPMMGGGGIRGLSMADGEFGLPHPTLTRANSSASAGTGVSGGGYGASSSSASASGGSGANGRMTTRSTRSSAAMAGTGMSIDASGAASSNPAADGTGSSSAPPTVSAGSHPTGFSSNAGRPSASSGGQDTGNIAASASSSAAARGVGISQAAPASTGTLQYATNLFGQPASAAVGGGGSGVGPGRGLSTISSGSLAGMGITPTAGSNGPTGSGAGPSSSSSSSSASASGGGGGGPPMPSKLPTLLAVGASNEGLSSVLHDAFAQAGGVPYALMRPMGDNPYNLPVSNGGGSSAAQAGGAVGGMKRRWDGSGDSQTDSSDPSSGRDGDAPAPPSHHPFGLQPHPSYYDTGMGVDAGSAQARAPNPAVRTASASSTGSHAGMGISQAGVPSRQRPALLGREISTPDVGQLMASLFRGDIVADEGHSHHPHHHPHPHSHHGHHPHHGLGGAGALAGGGTGMPVDGDELLGDMGMGLVGMRPASASGLHGALGGAGGGGGSGGLSQPPQAKRQRGDLGGHAHDDDDS